jgi:hypothetical protein
MQPRTPSNSLGHSREAGRTAVTPLERRIAEPEQLAEPRTQDPVRAHRPDAGVVAVASESLRR